MFRKKFEIIVFSALCLTSLFLALATTSTTSSSEYDPWVDLNDDGVIDSTDLGMLGVAWGSTGTPINKTDMLIDLQSRVQTLEYNQMEINATLQALESTVNELESNMSNFQQPKLIAFDVPRTSRVPLPTSWTTIWSTGFNLTQNSDILILFVGEAGAYAGIEDSDMEGRFVLDGVGGDYSKLENDLGQYSYRVDIFAWASLQHYSLNFTAGSHVLELQVKTERSDSNGVIQGRVFIFVFP